MRSDSLPSTSRMLRVPAATEGNSPAESQSIARKSDDAPLHDLDVATVFSNALARAGLSSKEAAAVMGLDKAHWSRQLHGADGQHISFQRLTRLPRVFWLELLREIAPALDVIVSSPDHTDRLQARVLDLVMQVSQLAQHKTRRIA